MAITLDATVGGASANTYLTLTPQRNDLIVSGILAREQLTPRHYSGRALVFASLIPTSTLMRLVFRSGSPQIISPTPKSQIR
jgi:hypothetical protein